MEPLSILCVLIGTLVIASRGPLIFAPSATLRFFNKLLATNARIRGIAAANAPLAAALITLPLGEGEMAGLLRFLGWLSTAATLWLLAAPDSYRRFAEGVLDFFESSIDEAIVRMMGGVASAIGIACIYFGIYVA